MPQPYLYPQPFKENKQSLSQPFSSMEMLFYTRDLVTLKIIGKDILVPSSSIWSPSKQHHNQKPQKASHFSLGSAGPFSSPLGEKAIPNWLAQLVHMLTPYCTFSSIPKIQWIYFYLSAQSLSCWEDRFLWSGNPKLNKHIHKIQVSNRSHWVARLSLS